MKKNILIVEDDLKLNNGIRLALKGIADYGTNELLYRKRALQEPSSVFYSFCAFSAFIAAVFLASTSARICGNFFSILIR